MHDLNFYLSKLNQWIWSPPLLILLVGTGIYYSILLKGLQFRYLWYSIKLVFTRHDNDAEGDVSQFQSLMTAMSATIGIGSITGVATAIATGGLGAVFWMWMVGLIGMATKYAEAILAVKFRVHDEAKEMSGGPMYYLERGLEWKGLAILFAFGGAIGAITTGNMIQSNSVADALINYISIDRIWIGLILAVFTGLVLLRGIKSIAWVTEFLVPVMAVIYIGGGLLIIILNYRTIPSGFVQILSAAFTKQAAFGGFTGSSVMLAMRMGVVRGIFSSEAGLGSSPIAAAAAKTDRPGRQAMISMSGAFMATFVVCTITALVISATNVLGDYSSSGEVLNGSTMVIYGFNRTLPGSGWIVTIAIIMFGYTTILGWAYYGEKCFEYLFGRNSVIFYRSLFTILVIFGATLGLGVMWNIADISNALMAFPNLCGLLGLSLAAKKESDSFLHVVQKEKNET